MTWRGRGPRWLREQNADHSAKVKQLMTQDITPAEVMDKRCTQCQAAPGRPCTDRDGTVLDEPHARRVRRAKDGW